MAQEAADGRAAAPPLTADDVLGVSSLLNNLTFFLNLKMMADVLGVRDVRIPPEVSQILELAKKLPDATKEQWRRLMAGKVHTAAEAEAKAKAAAKASKATPAKATAEEGEGEGTAKRKRQAWTEESQNELLRLADDKDYRRQVTGVDELHWSTLAKHLGFSAGQVVHRKYCSLKGIALPPSAKKAKTAAAAEGQGGEEKAAEVAEEEVEVLPQVQAGSGAGWSKEQEAELVKLVKNEGFRKQVLGKPKLKWSRLAEHFERSKRDVKAKYTALTGEDAD